MRRGVTVTEVLISIAVISLLVALVVPAVLDAREASRKTDCRNRLRQVGQASHNYYAAHDEFPEVAWCHLKLLPFLDHKPLYDKLMAMDPGQREKQSYVIGHRPVSVYICPSDSEANPNHYATNFRLNLGTDWVANGMAKGFHGLDPVRIQEVADGQSTTAFYSERLVELDLRDLINEVSNGVRRWPEVEKTVSQHPKRYWWHMKRRYDFHEIPTLVEDCRDPAERTTVWKISPVRPNALKSNMGSTYYHLGLPNETACRRDVSVSTGTGARGTAPPSSEHKGGVHLLMVDGSVHFVSELIDQTLWEALGTRHGGELIGSF